MPGLLTSETESGFLPTPKASTAGPDLAKMDRSATGISLQTYVHLWPTPQARDYFPPHKPEYIASKRAQGHGMSNLNDSVALWPTPAARDYKAPNSKPYSERGGGKKGEQLPNAVKFWPTPDANMGARGTQPEWEPKRKSGQPAQYTINQAVRDEGAGGQLNPQFVEWLMGWPLYWTSLEQLPAPTWGAWQEAFLPEPTDSRPSETDSAQPSSSLPSASLEEA